jgi:hypothetical protein
VEKSGEGQDLDRKGHGGRDGDASTADRIQERPCDENRGTDYGRPD